MLQGGGCWGQSERQGGEEVGGRGRDDACRSALHPGRRRGAVSVSQVEEKRPAARVGMHSRYRAMGLPAGDRVLLLLLAFSFSNGETPQTAH